MTTSSLWTQIRVLSRRRRLERSCQWTRAQLEEHQSREIAKLRRFALAHSPFYREFHCGYEDRPFHALPILAKATVMEHFDDLVSDRKARLADVETFVQRDAGGLFRDRHVVLVTSGTTGRRGFFLFDHDEWLTNLASLARPTAWGQPGKPPRGALIASIAPWHYSARAGQALQHRVAPVLRINAALPLTQIVKQLNEWQPEALMTYPSVLRLLIAEQLAGRLSIELRKLA